MKESCSRCNGYGHLVLGESIGPNEIRERSRIDCHDCEGTGLIMIDCAYCGRETPAEVMDFGHVPKCLTCYEQDRLGDVT
jgi:DnaJ-class molecular chaperone